MSADDKLNVRVELNQTRLDRRATESSAPKYCGATPDEWAIADKVLGLTVDLLPVVSDRSATISNRSTMKQLGKTPSYFNKDGEAVGFAKWTRHYSSGQEIGRWSKDPRLGICVQTRRLRALDIDVEDPIKAAQIAKVFCEALGVEQLPCRGRPNSGKRLLVFIVEGKLAKRRMVVDGGIVELLAEGQQFIFAGEHVSGARYEWLNGMPSNLHIAKLDKLDDAWGIVIQDFAVEPPVTARLTEDGAEDVKIDDPVADWLVANWPNYGFARDGRRLHVTCPWQAEHSDADNEAESSTSWLVAGTNGKTQGHFKCLHAHCMGRGRTAFLRAVGYEAIDAISGFDDMGQAPHPVPAPRRRFEAVPVSQFSSGPQLTWLIKGVLPRAGLGVIYGASGAGKSFITLDLLVNISLGQHWRDRRTIKSRVVYVAAEGVQGLRRRLQALVKHREIDLEDLDDNMLIIAEAPNLAGGEDAADLAEELCRIEADLVVIDTLAQTMAGGDENSAQDMGLVVARCRKIHEATCAMVLLIHHSGKDAAKGARGSTALRAACDFEAEVSRDDERRTFRLTKLKDGDDGIETLFRLEKIELGADEDLDPIASCVVEYMSAKTSMSTMVDKPLKGKWQRAVWQSALEMVDLAPDGPIDIEALTSRVIGKMPGVPDRRGVDRRPYRVGEAIEWLCKEGHLIAVEGGVAVKC